jgi:hypothetical protein
MKDLIKAIDNLPWIVKLILCVPALDIVWAIYRIVKGVTEQNIVVLAVGIIWIIGAVSIGWLIDLIGILLKGHPFLA